MAVVVMVRFGGWGCGVEGVRYAAVFDWAGGGRGGVVAWQLSEMSAAVVRSALSR